ncbi:VOC family protein [Gordonia phthalatica]|uniref:3-demethylubiquinone-9 3-methyltransferase n=1 Tax=Gordonia phthalatica TaxID=1136941 RepID=A0A0N9NHK7_9ACTN|nr:VOC family protein [Gordonia phthalatica]ALG84948.1 3-demethylubiquinone-9 3-methyltransferase [Gordonia phthalatica]
MAAQLNPYLMLGDTARPALEFYRGVLGGELTFRTYADMPGTPPESADRILHGSLVTTHGLVIMAADSPEGVDAPRGQNIAVSINGPDADTTQAWWDGLSDGATVEAPFTMAPWGHRFGMFIDRFGIRWMVSDGE